MTGMFVGLHVMLAERTNVPEFGLTMEEGKQFMDAAQGVMRHYSVQTTQKTLDWIAFIGVAGGMYGTRIAAYSLRMKAERGANPAMPQNVVQFNHAGSADNFGFPNA